MANTVTVTLLENGDRNVIVHVYLASDGGTGDLNNQVLINAKDLGVTRFRLARIDYNIGGFDAVIGFDSGTLPMENFKWVLTEGANHPIDFLDYNLVFDNSGTEGLGNLTISTTGFNSVADQGSILIKVVK